jgi:hypothetical protein
LPGFADARAHLRCAILPGAVARATSLRNIERNTRKSGEKGNAVAVARVVIEKSASLFLQVPQGDFLF